MVGNLRFPHDTLSDPPDQFNSHPSAQELDAVSLLLQDCTRMLICRLPYQEDVSLAMTAFKTSSKETARAMQVLVGDDLTFAFHQKSAAAGPAGCLLSPPRAPLSFVPVRRKTLVNPCSMQDVAKGSLMSQDGRAVSPREIASWRDTLCNRAQCLALSPSP